MTTTQRHYAMPEWLTRKDFSNDAWKIEAGTPVRGDAWTMLIENRMRVPLGGDNMSRLVRAHEMTHAKVSPVMIFQDGRYGPTTESLVSCEEYRVNTLAGQAGFDMTDLVDGSESKAGEVYGENKDWNNAIRALAALAGTKGDAALIRGVAKYDKEMAASLREVLKALKKTMRRCVKQGTLASTQEVYGWNKAEDDKVHGTHPDGWRHTITLAQLLDSFLIPETTDGEESKVPQEHQIKKMQSGEHLQFGRLLEKRLPKPVKVDGRLGRKRIASDTGRNPRRIDRMLTDPERKVFDRRAKGRGGVVLIDQSGSMSLTEENIWDIIKQAPGCVIIGYSHRSGSSSIPNIWVLAERGAVAETIPKGNCGNGVDGPAIAFAAKRLRSGEPFIWVCDGLVTDGDNDANAPNLEAEVVALVAKHKIHMVESISETVNALRNVAKGKKLEERLVPLLANRVS